METKRTMEYEAYGYTISLDREVNELDQTYLRRFKKEHGFDLDLVPETFKLGNYACYAFRDTVSRALGIDKYRAFYIFNVNYREVELFSLSTYGKPNPKLEKEMVYLIKRNRVPEENMLKGPEASSINFFGQSLSLPRDVNLVGLNLLLAQDEGFVKWWNFESEERAAAYLTDIIKSVEFYATVSNVKLDTLQMLYLGRPAKVIRQQTDKPPSERITLEADVIPFLGAILRLKISQRITRSNSFANPNHEVNYYVMFEEGPNSYSVLRATHYTRDKIGPSGLPKVPGIFLSFIN